MRRDRKEYRYFPYFRKRRQVYEQKMEERNEDSKMSVRIAS